MKILNLVDSEKSDIKFDIYRFPDGQQQVKITDFNFKHIVHEEEQLYLKEHVKIKSRLNNFMDLELIIVAVQSLRELGVKEIHLYSPYFLGSRSDRKFEDGTNNYLKTVICPIINSLNFHSVTVMDPHSDVLEALLNNFKKFSNFSVVNNAFNNIYDANVFDDKKFILISPDAGANKKVFKIADDISYKGEIVTCTKSRDEHGKLTRVTVPLEGVDCVDKDFIIIDDICDGGATFVNIADKILKMGYSNNVYLIVTHGIFSRDFDDLFQYFAGVYCTNSYSDIPEEKDPLYHEAEVKPGKRFVKQFNVF